MSQKYLAFNFIALALFAIDRWIKLWFFTNPTESFGGDFVLSLNYAANHGIAFGIGVNEFILPVLIIAVILVLVHYLVKAYSAKDSLTVFALTLILAGALSNLVDRMRYGFVIDYIDLQYFTVFNLADTIITIGVIILLFDLWLNRKLDKPKEMI